MPVLNFETGGRLMEEKVKALLLLEDGTCYQGEAFGKIGETTGEVVFNTCMTGYQEITTDPSYKGQIVTMTYPLIGNYGVNEEDMESYKTHVEGFVVKELCDNPSNFRCLHSAEEYFIKNGITGIKGIDTRALTQHLRQFGSMYGIISSQSDDIAVLQEKLNGAKAIKRELVLEVTAKKIQAFPADKDCGSITVKTAEKESALQNDIKTLSKPYKVGLLDCGVKYNIIRSLNRRGCDVILFPARTTAEEILACEPDGILLSNGPGDPENVPFAIENIKKLLGKKPILGICLGHQLLGLALGGKTYKLKFGHHGGNHPVRDFNTGRCYITSQNHNFALENAPVEGMEITHMNVNDNTVEGFRHKGLKVLSLQYHPEAAPGPLDSAYIFDEFVGMMDEEN